jgi:hypothetical protein
MTTIFVCNDQKAKYNQGICASPIEQARSRFSLWFAYAVDVASDLTGMYVSGTVGIVLLISSSHVSSIPYDLEPSNAPDREAGLLHPLWQRLDMHCTF